MDQNAMANSKKTGNKAPKPVLVLPQEGETMPIPETPFDSAPDSPELPAETAPAAPGPPKMRQKSNMSLWDQISAVPKEDWFNRKTYLYVYRKEPFSNTKTEGEPGYEMKYYEPMDIDAIMRRHGSGKYYAMLKTRPEGAAKDITIGDLLFTIYNLEFPPAMPDEVWKKDSRNARWAALMPKPEAPPPATTDLNKAFETVLQIQDRVKAQMDREETTEATPSTQLEALVNAASKLAEMNRPKEAAAQSTVSATAEAISLAEKIVTMRTENPMVAILSEQLKLQQAALDRMQAAQIDALRAEIASLKQKPADSATATPNALADKLISAAIDKLVGSINNPEPTTVVRSRLSPTMEFFKDMLPQIINSPLLVGIGTRLMTPNPAPNMQQQPPMTGVTGATVQQPQRPAAPTGADFQQFVQYVTPSMIGYLEESNGTNFAEWMAAGHEEWLPRIQTLSHASMPGQTGAPVVIAFYRQSQYWPAIMKAAGNDESRFTKFVTEFCAWKPEPEEPATAEPAETEDDKAEKVEV